MDAMERAARAIAAQAPAPAARAAVQPLRPPRPPGSQAALRAVDGSHAVLWDNGALWVVAYRAAAVGPGRALPVGPQVAVARPDEAQAVVDAAWPDAARPPRADSAEAMAEALRSAAEAEAARAACAVPAAAGSLLLLDGALRGVPPHAAALVQRVREAADAAHVRLVGVSKRSAHPGLEAFVRDPPPGAWAAGLEPGVFAARLHAAAPHVFRVDADTVEDVAQLLDGSRDAAYLGYPYLLAKAHNTVAITASETAGLRARLEAAVRREGPHAWQALRDFHHVLDRNVPG